MTGRRALRAWPLLLAVLGLPAVPAAADSLPEQILVAVTLNAEVKGDLLVYRTEEGDVLVRTADLARIGFNEPGGDIGRAIEEETYLSLKGMRGVAFRLDTKSASLKIAAAPHLLANRVIDLGAKPGRVAERSTDGSLFLNYGVEYRDSDSGKRAWVATGEVGARAGDWLLVSDGTCRVDEDHEEYLRLMSRAIRDDRELLQRLTLGDISLAPGALGGSVIVGGVGFERKPVLDPAFVRNPTFGFSGIAALPAEIEIAVDGVPMLKQKISPGVYDVRNFWERYGGYRQVDVTIRDIFGKETRLGGGFYFSDTLLRRGFHEYGYYLGFLRQEYANRSNEYGDLAASAYHRVGLSDTFTAGFAAEAAEGIVNGGPSLSFPLGGLGELTAAGRYSDRDGAGAGAGQLTYANRRKEFGWFFQGRVQGRGYATLGQRANDPKVHYLLDAGASANVGRLGSLSLAYAVEEDFEHQGHHAVSAALSSNLTNSLSLYATVRRTWDEQRTFEAFVGLTWRRNRQIVNARYEGGDGDGSTMLEAVRVQPEGTGYGYRAQAQREGARDSLRLDTQYNGPFGVYRADLSGYEAGEDNGGSIAFSTAGSLTVVGGEVSLGRPVRDSFGLVRVGGLPGVRVYRNSQEIGRTDEKGEIVVPTLSSFYDNQVRIEEKDVPMNYTIPQLVKFVSPAYRQGQVVAFDLKRFQAVSGFFQVQNGKGPRPLEYGMARVQVNGREVAFPTGKNGEFYLENIPPGRHEAAYSQNGIAARCPILVPESTSVLLELGTITCVLR